MNPNEIPNNINAPKVAINRPRNKTAVVLSTIIVLLILVIGTGFYILNKSIQDKNNQLASAIADKDTAQNELAKAQERIDQLDNPTAKANDQQRKADLEIFIQAVKDYRLNAGSYPTTESTLFVSSFERPYITNKLSGFVDPNTKKPYEFVPVAAVQTPPGVTLGVIQYQWPASCAGSEFDDTQDYSKAAARLILESGEIYCKDI